MGELQDFWTLVVDVWKNGVAGVDIGRWLGAAGIFICFLVLRGVFARFALGSLAAMAKRSRWSTDDQIVAMMEPPLRFVPIVLGVFFATQYLHLKGIFDEIALNIVRSLIAITLFWGLLRAVEPLSRVLEKLERIFTNELVEWIIKAVRLAILFVGVATVLQIWGVQVGPIIAGAGLLGVAVALGAQDLFKNLIAGILILAEKRFHKGDWIKADVVEGVVESIGFRSTLVRRFDKAPVMVPNTELSDTAVINYSQMTYRRIFWSIGVEYRTTVEQLHKIRDDIYAYITENEDFVPISEAALYVHIEKFGPSSIDMLLYCFTRTTVYAEYLKIQEALAYKIMEIVHDAGAGFAFPSQSIYIENFPAADAGDKAVPFQPPQQPKQD